MQRGEGCHWIERLKNLCFALIKIITGFILKLQMGLNWDPCVCVCVFEQ